MAERQHRVGGAVAAGIAVCLGAAGCSGGAAAEDSRGSDAVQVLHRAPGTLVDAGSSKATTSMEMATGGTRVTIRGQGVYDYRRQLGRLWVRLPQDPTGTAEHRPITELLAPGALFMKNRGAGVPADKWVRVDTAGLADGNLVTGGATDPFAAAGLLRGTRTATYLGKTRLAGVPVRHYRGTTELPAAVVKGFARRSVPFDAYLDEQGRVRKVRHEFSFVNGRQKGTVVVYSTTLLYDFGTPVDVRLPASKDIYAGKIAE
ncbi:hypothetical protein [Streptomyces cylindrosporus]|uniref:Lipoprotein n=1 Tax=Streptomyces cylindrosporus TaxID=2927583 RepID=A0ABS9Y464_9ACTN|nr:hypothetical protein [Streptomyces cylindrosporus]MCI3272007.1 hypothetical protein [Streptomyces cylindrosporus]